MSSVFVLFVHFPLHPCSPVPVPTVLQMSSCQYALNFRVGHDLSTKQQQPSLRVTIYTPRLASLAQPHLHGRHPCWCIFFSIIPPHCWCKFPSREPIQCIYPSHQGWTEGWIKNQLPFPRSRVVSFFFFHFNSNLFILWFKCKFHPSIHTKTLTETSRITFEQISSFDLMTQPS